MTDRLTVEREDSKRKEQARFQPVRVFIDHIVSPKVLVEQRHSYKRPTEAISLAFNCAFDSVAQICLLTAK